MNLIAQLDKEQMEKLSAGKTMPEFGPGDTVLVSVEVKEGEKSRLQAYEGVSIAAMAPASARTSPSARSRTARASSACSRCSRR